jgi:hypothetical protein
MHFAEDTRDNIDVQVVLAGTDCGSAPWAILLPSAWERLVIRKMLIPATPDRGLGLSEIVIGTVPFAGGSAVCCCICSAARFSISTRNLSSCSSLSLLRSPSESFRSRWIVLMILILRIPSFHLIGNAPAIWISLCLCGPAPEHSDQAQCIIGFQPRITWPGVLCPRPAHPEIAPPGGAAIHVRLHVP